MVALVEGPDLPSAAPPNKTPRRSIAPGQVTGCTVMKGTHQPEHSFQRNPTQALFFRHHGSCCKMFGAEQVISAHLPWYFYCLACYRMTRAAYQSPSRCCFTTRVRRCRCRGTRQDDGGPRANLPNCLAIERIVPAPGTRIARVFSETRAPGVGVARHLCDLCLVLCVGNLLRPSHRVRDAFPYKR